MGQSLFYLQMNFLLLNIAAFLTSILPVSVVSSTPVTGCFHIDVCFTLTDSIWRADAYLYVLTVFLA